MQTIDVRVNLSLDGFTDQAIADYLLHLLVKEGYRAEVTLLATPIAPSSYACQLCGQRIDDGKPCGCGARH